MKLVWWVPCMQGQRLPPIEDSETDCTSSSRIFPCDVLEQGEQSKASAALPNAVAAEPNNFGTVDSSRGPPCRRDIRRRVPSEQLR
ncbi:hypothetical protein T12_15484 [Trichinella patagoniensis]|uniref:Uncharacterized protein n=1 Tax=Trichinella patagoniensis TaxID=990121 RepID=A0A0V1ACT6_9BILA|nr:hypothetical protein T12_15484 [Trichinella patagoniensis]